MKTNLSAYQSRVLWAIWRKTYGWHKKADWIANSTLVEMTGISKGHISRTIKELKMRNIVTNSGNKLAFNKDYQQWRELPYRVRGYPIGQKVTPSGKKVTPSGGVKRNSSKEIIQKKEKYAEFVKMSKNEYKKLIEKYGKEEVQEMIEKLDNYKGSKGKTYESDYRAILNWVADEIIEKYKGDIQYPRL